MKKQHNLGGLFVFALSLAILLGGCSKAELDVARVIDGDTLTTSEESTIRLLQIDTPEKGIECYAEEARLELISILSIKDASSNNGNLEMPEFRKIRVEKDSVSDETDRYGRDLAYVFVGDLNVNLELVKRGAAAPYFYQGQKGKYSKALITAAEIARADKVGVWGACPNAILDPRDSFTSGSTVVVTDAGENKLTTLPSAGANCDPNYDGCIPLYPPDLNCPDIRALGLAPVHRIAGDPHGLDRDGDGVGCE